MHNATDTTVYVGLYGYESLIVKDRLGHRVRLPDARTVGSPPLTTSREDFVRLHPEPFYGVVREMRFPRPGEYTAQLLWERADMSRALGFTMWHGRAWSNVVKLTIRS